MSVSLARRSLSSFTKKLSDPANRVQCYLSRSNDPFLNLSIEDHILRASPADSTVLFLYTNRPCVIIGRNQNPWTEVNLSILNANNSPQRERGRPGRLADTEPLAIGTVELVRRRSGGGTVFHDEGNLNWSITCPRADFTRDKHAEMVVRALRKMGIDRARVNERHDIVLDQGSKHHEMSDPTDTHRTPYTIDDPLQPRPLKVSGSAYKLTRGRALHHATTLLASPNLHIIPQYLRSPAKAFIEAKGVESVSSPVGNIGLDMQEFQTQVQAEFADMYINGREPAIVESVGEEHLDIPEIKKGYEELKTKDWIFSQTPQFTLKLSTYQDHHLEMTVHHGIIKAFEFRAPGVSTASIENVQSLLLELRLQDIPGWQAYLRQNIRGDDSAIASIANQLDRFLPIPELLDR
ncbi:hypothetical protein B0J11DRAFT_433970 [Dendryphion nanum]|uniref:Putative lipoate-protein ligase A n=1 Tax=Dendryphion nanum TaxID=256645 RepID=A0A9P9INN5_9PLEO|nr:hypothetical protein B0J11DRAFT_433970 [Dendryphion nanum]